MTRVRHAGGWCWLVGFGFAVALASPAMVAGQQQAPAPAAAIDVQRLGPQVGDAVPAFSLVDQAGVTRNLASILGPKGALLVFARSADW